MAAQTKLTLSTIDLHPFSARGATYDINPIDASGGSRRDINGTLHDLSDPAFNKYTLSISCSDFRTPSFNNLKRGMTVVVGCPFEWFYPIPEPDETTPGDAAVRSIVAGSLRDKDGIRYYRPEMTMMVLSFGDSNHEFAATEDWTLVLEEV